MKEKHEARARMWKNRSIRTRRPKRWKNWTPNRRSLRSLGVVLGMAILVGGGIWLYQKVRPVVEEWTQVRDIVVSGLEHVSREEILSRLALPDHASLLALDMEQLTARVEAHPWVAQALFDRVFPETLAIHIRERRGVAVLRAETDRRMERWLLDEDGVLLEKLSRLDRALPVLVGIDLQALNQDAAAARERVRAGLRVAELLGDAFPEMPLIDLSHPEVIVAELSGLRFTFGAAVDEQWERFQLLYPSIRNKLTSIPQEVDLRYAQKVILRPRG